MLLAMRVRIVALRMSLYFCSVCNDCLSELDRMTMVPALSIEHEPPKEAQQSQAKGLPEAYKPAQMAQ